MEILQGGPSVPHEYCHQGAAGCTATMILVAQYSFLQVLRRDLGEAKGGSLLRRVKFHYTPTHGSWLKMVEIEIGILSRLCLSRRIADRATLRHEVDARQDGRNGQGKTIEWTFTRQDADLY
jgi:hypothetical protein